ncbi:hypothetical protein, partial [Pseudomonas fluorescens]|uniref:hypothetical protein n=1 Tax=Pseudomonas fluorescens TaxID=294 RepID=UPI001C4AA9C5
AREKPESAAFIQHKRGVFAFFAGELAPTDHSVFRTHPSALFGLPDRRPKTSPKQKVNFYINH